MRADPSPPATAARRYALPRPGSLLAWGGVLVCAVVAVVAALQLQHQATLRTRMLTLPADAVPAVPELVALAQTEARPLYAARCAGCHGAAMQGNAAIGAPGLRDGHWRFGTGRVFDIERTILYGVRAGGRSRNVTEMPAFGLTGLLSPIQIHSVVTYLLWLNLRSDDAAGAAEGRAVYLGKGGCSDCHGGDARGNSDYGAPNLTDNSFADGNSAAALYASIYTGRHGMMPGFAGVLSLGQIRALAVAIHAGAGAAPGGS
jgi:cytochrome c oxidase cbb3-type subunit 3